MSNTNDKPPKRRPLVIGLLTIVIGTVLSLGFTSLYPATPVRYAISIITVLSLALAVTLEAVWRRRKVREK